MTMALERPLTAPERRLLDAMQAKEVEAWPLAAVLEACGTDVHQAVAVGLGRGTHGPWTGAGLGGDHDMVHARHDRCDSLDGLLEERLLDWIEGQGGSTSMSP